MWHCDRFCSQEYAATGDAIGPQRYKNALFQRYAKIFSWIACIWNKAVMINVLYYKIRVHNVYRLNPKNWRNVFKRPRRALMHHQAVNRNQRSNTSFDYKTNYCARS
jgi:hypothetical protein